MQLLFGERICVFGSLRLSFFLFLLRHFVFVVIFLLSLSAFARLCVTFEVLSNQFCELFCVNSRSQNLTHFHQCSDVFIPRAKSVGTTCEYEVITDEINKRASDGWTVFQFISLDHIGL